MKLILTSFLRFTFCATAVILLPFYSCTKHSADDIEDEKLFAGLSQGQCTYYQQGNILQAAPGSPHGSFRLRFNAIASAALDSNGKLPVGAVFPDGSIIIKEALKNGDIDIFAVMKKNPTNSRSASGWLWAEFNAKGEAVFSTGKKGNGCISCHSITPNRDQVRSFVLH